MDLQSFGIGVCVGMLLWITLYWSIHNRRPTKRAADGVVLLAEDGELQIHLNDGSSYRWRPPRR